MFPPGFLMGTATAATQVEGGGINNNITRWALSHEKDGWIPFNPGLDHWNRIQEDYEHFAANGHNAHGFVIDWGRVMPNGVFDSESVKVLEHYREEILTCRALGMEPNVTLMEYAIPNWLEDNGGLLNPDCPEYFREFTQHCLDYLGDVVTFWTTMNEPNTLIGAAYVGGLWSPGETSIFKGARAAHARRLCDRDSRGRQGPPRAP